MATWGEKGWKNSWWRRVAGKVYNIEEWKKLLRTARNCRILLMPMEWNECHIWSRHHFGRRVMCDDPKSYGPWYYLVCWWANLQNFAPNNNVTTAHNTGAATWVQRGLIRPRWSELAVPVSWPVPEAAVTVFSTPDDGCCDTWNM